MPEYRCTQCSTVNSHDWARHEKNVGKHKEKTTRVPCTSCGTETVQNKKGA